MTAHEYVIRKRGDEWCLISETTGRTLGCHPTREGAIRQERAIKARQNMAEIKGIEIFAAGTHNGDKYTEKDLDAMIEAFKDLDFTPPLKDGHNQTSTNQALGWIANLRRIGSKLVADFVNLPDEIFKAIKDRRFNHVSSEIYWNLKRGGKTFKRALKAVALLGADIPAVAGLKPLSESFSEKDYEAAKAYEFDSDLAGDWETIIKEIEDKTHEYEWEIEIIEELCPECAESMRELGLDVLKFQLAGMPPQLRQGLCRRFGPDEGMFTRCMGSTLGGFSPRDKRGFCAALHRACTGKWPAESRSLDEPFRKAESDMTKQTDQKPDEKVDDEPEKKPDEKLSTEDQVEKELAERSETARDKTRETQTEREVDVLKKELAEAQEKLNAESEERRRAQVKNKVDGVKIVALRRPIEALYELATREGAKVKMYDAQLARYNEVPAEDVLDELVKSLNKAAEHLYEETAKTDVTREDKPTLDDVDEAIEARIRELREKDKTLTYARALQRVLDEDEELARRYEEKIDNG